MDITDIYIYIFIHSFIYAIICDKKAFFCMWVVLLGVLLAVYTNATHKDATFHVF